MGALRWLIREEALHHLFDHVSASAPTSNTARNLFPHLGCFLLVWHKPCFRGHSRRCPTLISVIRVPRAIRILARGPAVSRPGSAGCRGYRGAVQAENHDLLFREADTMT